MQLSTQEVAQICGIPAATLYDWLKLQVIASVPARVKGKRYPGFTPRQATLVQLATELRRYRFGLDEVREALAVVDAGWDGAERGQLLGMRDGWRFAQEFSMRVDGHVEPFLADPPLLFDIGHMFGHVLLNLDLMEEAADDNEPAATRRPG